MSRLIKTALALSAVGYAAAAIGLLKTSSLTMILFFFVGLPCFFIGFVLYLTEVLRDLRRHRVL